MRYTLTLLVFLVVLPFGAVRFIASGLLPGMTSLRGDFAVTFPGEYFARLRPDWPPPPLAGPEGPGELARAGRWSYGPMMHFITVPLLALPTPAAVPPVWTVVNTLALAVSFLLVLRIAGHGSRTAVGLLAGLWLGFQPLANALAQGIIEIVELAVLLAGLAALGRGRHLLTGSLIACAVMIKYLPVGFFGWLALRGPRLPLAPGAAVITVIALVTAATLGWQQSNSLRIVPGRMVSPPAGLHEASITSAFLHRTAVLDSASPDGLRWSSAEQRLAAERAGLLTSTLLALAYALIMWRRRATPIAAPEIAVLFVLMLLLPPWNHDHYYIFALVPLSIVVLTALDGRRGQPRILAAALAAYLLMSPPVPFSLIDATEWFDLPFAHVWNFAGAPVYGALLLLALATYQWLLPASMAARQPSTTAATPASGGPG